MGPRVYITNIQSFCAAHRLHNPRLSDEENKKLFGKCNHFNAHGHNYKVEASVVGDVDPKSGCVMNLTDLKAMILQVIEPMDHKRLDTDIEFFRDGVVTTAENISVYIWVELEKLLPSNVKLYNIRVHETEKNIVDFRG